MLSIYLDFFTLAWATLLVIALPSVAWKNKSISSWLSLLAVSLYLIAQTGWTTAYFSGDLFGASVSNFVWFFFNSTVLALVSLNLRGK